MNTAIHIDCFCTGIDELTCKQQGDYIAVLRALHQAGRFSVFEATDNVVISRTMTRLFNKGLVLKDANGRKTTVGVLVRRTGGDYPWTTCELTDAGRQLLEENPA